MLRRTDDLCAEGVEYRAMNAPDEDLKLIHAGDLDEGDTIILIGHRWTVEKINRIKPERAGHRTTYLFALVERDRPDRVMDYHLYSDSRVLVPRDHPAQPAL